MLYWLSNYTCYALALGGIVKYIPCMYSLSHASLCQHMYVGMIDLNLSVMPKPVSDPSDCSLNQLQDEREENVRDLFLQKQTKGWWPVYKNVKGHKQFAVS